MRITSQPIGAMGANAYLLASDDKNILIDPGGSPDEWDDAFPKIDLILCTHGHFDHIAGSDLFRTRTDAPLMIHLNDADALTRPDVNASDLIGRYMTFRPADGILSDGDTVRLDDHHKLQVITTPGHTPGGICLLLLEDGSPTDLFSGDTLFAGSIGRLDIGGDPVAMKSSLERLMMLPDPVRVHPGHGPATTIGQERRQNPYLQGDWFTL